MVIIIIDYHSPKTQTSARFVRQPNAEQILLFVQKSPKTQNSFSCSD